MKHRNFLLTLLGLFTLLVGFHFHGFSISMWRTVLDGSEPAEIVWGNARPQRTDDWLVNIPFSLAQTAHSPRFPVVNSLIGFDGQNMMAPAKGLTRNFLGLFRPTMWGFLLGDEIGLSWGWWSAVFGVSLSFFYLFLIVTGDRFSLAAWGALAVVFSPVFQFWSFFRA